MPQIKVRGVNPELVCAISTELIDELSTAINSSKDSFTLECITSTFIQDGRIVPGYPFIDVGWFNRGQAKQDEVARIIYQHFNRAGITAVDIVFTNFPKENYYENDQHF